MKLRTKMFFIFTVIAILPLIIITAFSYTRYVQTINQRMDDISSTLFENALENANNTLNTIRQTAGLFTFYSDGDFSVINNLKKFSDPQGSHNSYEVLKANQNIRFVCQNVIYSYDYIYGVYVFTPSGAVLGHTSGRNGDIARDYDPESQRWYGETLALDGRLYVSPVTDHSMFIGRKPSLFFSQSLRDVYTHEFLGVLVIDCDPSVFDLSLSNTMPDITMLTLDNPDTGHVLYSNADDFDYGFARHKKVVLRDNLNVEPLRLTAVFDYGILFREFNATGVMMLLLSLGCGAGAIVLAYVTSKNMVRPIEHLSRKMATQRGHALELTSSYLDRPDEVGTLYNEYNAMVEELNTSVKQDYQDKLVILDAQMKSLEARINSHFLFNTLESINSMAELDENRQIATMSLALGNMFRYTIKTQSELVTLAQELENVDDYVSIQKIRFDHRFRLQVDIGEDLRGHSVLKLILQPLVENSLYHGLNYCAAGDAIRISAQVKNDCLLIFVEDNGVGMDAETLNGVTSRLREEASFTELGRRGAQSIGLKNIHSRIELYYGKGYGLTVFSRQGAGTSIQIKLPVLKQKEESACTAM